MKKITLFSTIILLLGAIYGTSNAQEKFKNRYAIGINYNAEWRVVGTHFDRGDFISSPGISGEVQFDKNNGIEAGIFYWQHKYVNRYLGVEPIPNLKEKYISFRLGYKFYSNILNFGLGMNFDWETSDLSGLDKWGFYAMIGKDFQLSQNLVLEPSVRFNYMEDDRAREVAHLGIGIKLKYRF